MNSATSASTLRLTRYERDKLSLAATPRFRTLDRESCGQQRLQPGAKVFDVDARPDTKVDASDAAEPIEIHLGTRDVHHGKALLRARRRQTGDKK